MSHARSAGSGASGNEARIASPLVRAGIDALDIGFAVFDKSLTLIACNRTFQKLRNFPAELCRTGTHIAELYRFNARRGDYGAGDERELVETRMARARTRKETTLEYPLANGRILHVRYTPLKLGGLLLSYVDVTEQRKAEQALRKSEERYSLAMANANEGMWDWSADSNDIVVSDSYKALIGLDMSGDRLPLEMWVSLIHPDDLHIREKARKAHLEGTAGQYDCEYRVRVANGEYRWFRDRAKTQRDGKGKIIRMLGSLNDVTERKEAQMALIEADRLIRDRNETLATISTQLSKYLSPQIYASIFSGKQHVEIASTRKKLTIFFADIVNFTQIAEEMEAEELTSLLNHYLTEISKVALEHGATIDKYIGDAIVAFFGDPESRGVKADALACVNMAIAMQARMQELQRIWHDQGVEKPFQIRIGINTGFCTVGNFGSDDRMDYTIVGSEVNLAARLQSHGPPDGILIGHETFSLVKDAIAVEETTPLKAKGFSRPVQCYHVLGRLDELKQRGRIVREYDEGVRIYLDLFRADRKLTIRLMERILGDLKR